MDGSLSEDGSGALIFADGKDEKALRTIGEVSRALGLKPHVLRYWEEQFPALRPLKRSGSRRYYRPEDLALIAEIDRLVHREGYTLRGARKALEGRAAAREKAVPVDQRVNASTDSGLHDSLKSIRSRLEAALEAD